MNKLSNLAEAEMDRYELPIKVWRNRAGLTQARMAALLGIPTRTIENWDMGTRMPPAWSTKLLIKELMEYTEARMYNHMLDMADHVKSDENGNRPIVSWVRITKFQGDEFLEYFPDMYTALDGAKDCEIACVLLQADEDGHVTLNWYEDRKGTVQCDHMGFDV